MSGLLLSITAVIIGNVVVVIVIVVNAGNSGRLMEMLHGSDGWGKLVSELQQKEEDDAQQAAVQADQQQQLPPKRRKRGRPPKDGCQPPAQATRFDCPLLQMFPLLQAAVFLAKLSTCLQRSKDNLCVRLCVFIIN